MENLISLSFNAGSVRIIADNAGALWWVAKDACDAIGITKYRDAISRLDDEERCLVLVDTPGGPQSMSAVSESGLYSLILTSRTPESKAFKKWVTTEVLPTIRREGGYLTPQKAVQLMSDPATMRKFMVNMLALTDQYENTIRQLEPKANSYDQAIASTNTVTTNEIASHLGVGSISLNNFLANQKVQYKSGRRWYLYSEYRGHGYTKDRTHTHQTSNGTETTHYMVWTEKGRAFVINLWHKVHAE